MFKLRYLIFPILVVIVILSMRWYAKVDYEEKAQTPSINDLALMPDKLLHTSKVYFDEYSITHGIEYLEKAIEAMEVMERDADQVSDHTIKESIEALRYVRENIVDQVLTEREVSHIFVRVLNSLAYTQIRISEDFQRKNETIKAEIALNFAVEHLHNALRFAMGKEWDLEARLVMKLDSLVEHVAVDTDEMIVQLDIFLLDIEQLIQH